MHSVSFCFCVKFCLANINFNQFQSRCCTFSTSSTSSIWRRETANQPGSEWSKYYAIKCINGDCVCAIWLVQVSMPVLIFGSPVMVSMLGTHIQPHPQWCWTKPHPLYLELHLFLSLVCILQLVWCYHSRIPHLVHYMFEMTPYSFLMV